ncbi:MAG: hypothetical protein ACLRS8_16130 [Parabacteroides merdae]
MVLLDLALLPFRRFGVLPFAGCKRAEQGGGGGMALAGQFLHDFFPCAGRGGGCAEREEARGAECVFHVKCFIKFVQCSDVPFGGEASEASSETFDKFTHLSIHVVPAMPGSS